MINSFNHLQKKKLRSIVNNWDLFYENVFRFVSCFICSAPTLNPTLALNQTQTLSFPYTPYHDSFFNLCPLIQHQKLFHDQKFSLFFLSEMKDELPPLRQSLFSNVPPFFNYIPNGRNGRFGSSFVRPHTRVQNCHHRF